MLDTIAYCLGFTTNRVPPIEETCPSFTIKQTKEEWTLVDINNIEGGGEKEEKESSRPPTPTSSSTLEHSWLVTPPPCFDAEDNVVVEEFSLRENLLIEHPSMFVPLPLVQENDPVARREEKLAHAIRERKRTSTSIRRCQRRPSCQTSSTLSPQNRRSRQSKHNRCDAWKRSNKGYKKIRQLVQQPRKRS